MTRLGFLTLGSSAVAYPWTLFSLPPAARLTETGLGGAAAGGDVAFWVRLADRVRILVADVAGHGEEAAPMAHALLRSFAHAASLPATPLQGLASVLDSVVGTLGGDESYATACLVDCFVDGTFVIANCGHPWPLVADSSRRCQEVRPTALSLPLGLAAEPSTDRHHVGTGGRLMIRTDGLNVGRAATAEFVQAGDVSSVLAGVLASNVQPVRREDDTTAVIVEWGVTRPTVNEEVRRTATASTPHRFTSIAAVLACPTNAAAKPASEADPLNAE